MQPEFINRVSGPPDANPGSDVILEVSGLRKYHDVHHSLITRMVSGKKDLKVKAVDGVSLKIKRKQIIGLVGESGCGKSTLGKTIVGLHKPTDGKIMFDGREVSGYSNTDMNAYHQKMQMIFQNPYACLNPRKTVRDIVSDPLKLKYKITNSAEREEIVLELLHKVGLSPRAINLYPHQFSGGQRQRIGIARAIAMQPEFIVADEPVSALDVSVQAQIINLLQELQEEYQLTYLFVAHDLSVIYYISDFVAVMYLGKIVESAETEELFSHPLHPYTQALLSAAPVINKDGAAQRIILEGTVPTPVDPPPGCRFASRCFAQKGPECLQREPEGKEISPGHWVACHLYEG